MNSRRNSNQLSLQSIIVGTIHSPESLRAAIELKTGDLDFLEIRADAFAGETERIFKLLPQLSIPLIVTVRHHGEGGARPMPLVERRKLFDRLLPYAALIDVELRSVKQLASTIEKARAGGRKLILSHHDFKSTPSEARLHDLAGNARNAGADIFKIAVVTSTPADLITLLSFMQHEQRVALSVMGMGHFGKISRLLFAQAGSVLNYGFLHCAQVSGQWPARLLKQRLEELRNAE